VVHTHQLTFDGPLVTKRYTSWQRGEHQREWKVLRHLHEHAPGLAPRPVGAMLNACPPVITMARVPGAPLPNEPSSAQLAAVRDAVTWLWEVPHLATAGPWSDDLHHARPLTDGPRPAGTIPGEAYDAATRWWQGPDPGLLSRRPVVTVLGHRDPNMANYLWDGHRIRIVDFEDTAVSDPATELAMMMEHLSWRHVTAGELRDRFDVDPGRLLAARRLWAMFWLWLLRPGGPAAGRNPPGTADQQAQRLLQLLAQ
jgi:aminoglycoside phosphotransferase (APT) family kinase protein